MKSEISRAAEILRAGGLVAFPTETVYGLGADASSAAAVARLYAGEEGGRAFSGVAAPSANLFGNVSATTAAHVRADLKADLVLDGGASELGIESTILDLSGSGVVLLRPGRISELEIEDLLKTKIQKKEDGSPRHSGGLERHYAPKTPALLVPPHELDAEIARRGASVAVLAFSKPDERVEYWIRMPKDAAGYAHKLYAALRELDTAGCTIILIESPPGTVEWTAVRDRLHRAAG